MKKNATSFAVRHSTENMREVKVRSSFTASGTLAIAPYKLVNTYYEIVNINLGSNFISKLEVVSALNSFNLANSEYHFYCDNCIPKYNPKIYLGTVQSASVNWNMDVQKGQTNGLPSLPNEAEKSGSWPKLKMIFL